jgi:hypothetical protein
LGGQNYTLFVHGQKGWHVTNNDEDLLDGVGAVVLFSGFGLKYCDSSMAMVGG